MQAAKVVLILLWFFTGLSVCLVLLGLSSSDPLAMLFATSYGSMFLCLFAPFLASYYARLQPLLVVLLLISILTGALYVNAWACRLAGTRDIHLLDHVHILYFCIPGAITLLMRVRKGPPESQ